MHTPTGMSGADHGYMYASQTSLHSMVSMGHLPPGHGYIPKKAKPDKPYGPSFVSVMNRTWRGPGLKYVHYALGCLCAAVLFFAGGALYFGHRTVSRMTVLRSEVLGALMVAIGILCVGGIFHFIYRAREESNKWRSNVRFKSEGLFTAAAVNEAYVPDDNIKLASGTYGPRAMKEVPRPSRSKQPGGGRSRAPSAPRPGPPPAASSQARLFEKKGQQKLSQVDDYDGMDTVRESYEPPARQAPVMEPRVGYQPPSASSSMARSGYVDRSFDEEYHDSNTLPLNRGAPSPVQFGGERIQAQPRSSPTFQTISSPQSLPLPASLPPIHRPSPMGPARPDPLPPVHRPPPQVHRPSPQAWKSGSPSPSPMPQPQMIISPQMLPPVQRKPVSTMRSPPQPTIQLAGMKHGTSESEL